MAKRPVPLYDFKAFGAAIKAARKEYGESRKTVSDALYISPRYLANIENKGQQPSLQVFYDLVTRYHISVDQFFFPNDNAEKSTQRRQLDTLLDSMSDILGLEKLRVEQLINGKYSSQKPFAKKRIGNKLRADTFLSVVKQNAVSAIAVAAFPFYKAVDFPALGRRKPL